MLHNIDFSGNIFALKIVSSCIIILKVFLAFRIGRWIIDQIRENALKITQHVVYQESGIVLQKGERIPRNNQLFYWVTHTTLFGMSYRRVDLFLLLDHDEQRSNDLCKRYFLPLSGRMSLGRQRLQKSNWHYFTLHSVSRKVLWRRWGRVWY